MVFPWFFHGFPRNSGKKAMGNSESRPIWRQDMAASAKDYWRLMSLKAPHGPAADGNDGTTQPISQKMEKWTLYDYFLYTKLSIFIMKPSNISKMWQYFLYILSFWKVLYARSMPPDFWLDVVCKCQGVCWHPSKPTNVEFLKLQGIGKTHDTFINPVGRWQEKKEMGRRAMLLPLDAVAPPPSRCVGMICNCQIHKTSGSSLHMSTQWWLNYAIFACLQLEMRESLLFSSFPD